MAVDNEHKEKHHSSYTEKRKRKNIILNQPNNLKLRHVATRSSYKFTIRQKTMIHLCKKNAPQAPATQD